jgi:hypothetical protein
MARGSNGVMAYLVLPKVVEVTFALVTTYSGYLLA